MRCLRESAFLRVVVLPFALVLWLSGCHKWVDLEPPYGPAIEAAETREFRLTVKGERRETESATLRGDTLWAGTLPIPLKDLEAVEVRRKDVPATVGATMLVFFGVALMAAAICAAEDCIGFDFGN